MPTKAASKEASVALKVSSCIDAAAPTNCSEPCELGGVAEVGERVGLAVAMISAVGDGM